MTYPKTKQIRLFNRTEAEKRQAKYDLLTLQQKLDKLPPPPHATKERNKLEAQLEASKKPSVKKVEGEVLAVQETLSVDEKAAIKAEIKAKKFNKS